MLLGPSTRTPSSRARAMRRASRRRPFGAGVRESVAEDGRDWDAARAALLERALDRIAGRHDKGVVDIAGRFGKTAVRALAEHFAARRVDRHDASRVAVLAQEAQGARAVLRASPDAPTSATARGAKRAWARLTRRG